ncbi:MAG TPA: SxtJ family membrane protein [Acidobacteriota bacterium]|nr:SxtJ family membrane protein [Acidobacteriota bacterium]
MAPKKRQTDASQLRKFGIVMAVAFASVGSLLLWRERPAGPYLLYVGAAFLVTGLVVPRVLAPIERLWMALARVLQVVMTTLILTLTFFVVMTPMGFLLRLSGKDLLDKRRDPDAESYWVPVDPDGPVARPDKPY